MFWSVFSSWMTSTLDLSFGVITDSSLDVQAMAPAPEDEAKDNKASSTESTQPLAPPPRPGQGATTEPPDYFSSVYGTNFSLEPNPFEQSFSNSSPEKSLLPPVAALTSPAS